MAKKIIKFEQFNTTEWVGHVKILDSIFNPWKDEQSNFYGFGIVAANVITTNLGTFKNESGDTLKKGYTYLLRLSDDNVIIETGMSCVDLVILVPKENGYKVLSIKRGRPPFVGMWANPGGNIDEGEQPIDAAIRELEEETGLVLDPSKLKYVGLFDKPWRDPRNKNCVSHAFVSILDKFPKVKAADDATDCMWNDVNLEGDMNVKMAFDHNEVIKKAVNKI